jgi:hypothetical protein
MQIRSQEIATGQCSLHYDIVYTASHTQVKCTSIKVK